MIVRIEKQHSCDYKIYREIHVNEIFDFLTAVFLKINISPFSRLIQTFDEKQLLCEVKKGLPPSTHIVIWLH